MSKIIITTSFVLLAPILLWAQSDENTTNTLTIGTQTIAYEEAISITSGVLYYDKKTEEPNAVLVASVHDTNNDDEDDVWLVYDQNGQATLEAYDTNNDQAPDVFVTLTSEGEVIALEGEGAAQFERDTPTPFSPESILNANADTDLVGDLSDISIAPKDNNWVFFVILFIVGMGLYFLWKRQS